MHYFPVGIGLATLFAAILLGLLLLLQIGLLSHAYSALGLDPRVATLALFGSLLGSYINLPLLHLPEERIVSREVVEIFGVPFLAPVTADWPGTILAINVGGAVIPILLSFYLLMRYDLWGFGALATAIVAFVVHRLATPVPAWAYRCRRSPRPCWRLLWRWRCRAVLGRRSPISAAVSAS